MTQCTTSSPNSSVPDTGHHSFRHPMSHLLLLARRRVHYFVVIARSPRAPSAIPRDQTFQLLCLAYHRPMYSRTGRPDRCGSVPAAADRLTQCGRKDPGSLRGSCWLPASLSPLSACPPARARAFYIVVVMPERLDETVLVTLPPH
jgi:hypothetical protein